MISAAVHRLIVLGSALAMLILTAVVAAPASYAYRPVYILYINYYDAAGNLILAIKGGAGVSCTSETPPANAATATIYDETPYTWNLYSGTCGTAGGLIISVAATQTLTFTNPGTGSSFLPWDYTYAS
jgi:hypothetical protein